jgi:hypothetical protein
MRECIAQGGGAAGGNRPSPPPPPPRSLSLQVSLYEDAWLLHHATLTWVDGTGGDAMPLSLEATLLPPVRHGHGVAVRDTRHPWPTYRLWVWGGASPLLVGLLAVRRTKSPPPPHTATLTRHRPSPAPAIHFRCAAHRVGEVWPDTIQRAL